jgi:hypothetical protein
MCPSCHLPVELDMIDSRGRMWHANCVRTALAAFNPEVIGGCPECLGLVMAGDVAVYDLSHRRRWHPECVTKALGKIV